MTSLTKPQPVVVVHGSAARHHLTGLPQGQHPRDVDVVYAHTSHDDAATTARRWADTHGHHGLPLDLKPTAHCRDSHITVPAPWDEANGHAVHLTPGARVTWQVHHTLPALIRSELPPRQIAAIAAREAWRLTVSGPDADADGWDTYIEGLTALRAAAHKHPQAWAAVVSATRWGREIDYLLQHGPDIQPEHAPGLAAGSPVAAGPGAVVVALSAAGIRQPYRPGIDVTHELGIPTLRHPGPIGRRLTRLALGR